jgi:mannose-6-phosphate isomerase
MEALVLSMNNINHIDWHYDESLAKIVNKPWGKEIWINYRSGEKIGDEMKLYVMKKLLIHKGTKTSLQLHKVKTETNFLLSGRLEAWYESKPSVLEKKILSAGAIWTIAPGIKHRIVTLEDVILLEASTPEVDDVLRFADDTMRGDGRVETEHT